MVNFKIPQSELTVMKVIWESEKPLSSKQIIEILQEKRAWKRTTTLTLLSKLVQKDFLSAEKNKIYTYYTPLISKQKYQGVETEYFLSNIHDGSIKSLISSLKENSEISKSDLDELELWIRYKKECAYRVH